MNIYKVSKMHKLLWWLVLTVLATSIFSTNLMEISPSNLFNTYRDGSEALVLGKIIADVHGVPIQSANLCFVGKDKVINGGPDVLAVYPRLENFNAVIPSNLSDANWINGLGSFGAVFLLPRAQTGVLGYASNELLPGQQVHFSNGETRVVTKIESTEKFLKVYFSGEKLDGRLVGYPNRIKIFNEDVSRYISAPYRSIPGYAFSIFIASSIGTIFYRYYANHQNKVRDMGLFLAFLMPPLSWFILGKAHSYVHTHLNFVLWYFGFAACILYLSFIGIKILLITFVGWANKTSLGNL